MAEEPRKRPIPEPGDATPNRDAEGGGGPPSPLEGPPDPDVAPVEEPDPEIRD